MQIEKIKSINRRDFHGGVCGPTEVVTLGFKCNKDTYLLGSFYYGPGMNKETPEEVDKLEALIDHIVKASSHAPLEVIATLVDWLNCVDTPEEWMRCRDRAKKALWAVGIDWRKQPVRTA